MAKPELMTIRPFEMKPGQSALEVLHEMTCEVSSEMFADTGFHYPTWHLLGNDGKLRVIITPWEDNTEQMASREMIIAMLMVTKSIAYSFVTEGYVATLDRRPGETEEDMQERRWKELPDRLVDAPEHLRDEVLMIDSHVRHGDSYKMTQWIINSKRFRETGKGKPFLGLRIDEPLGGSKGSGRMWDLFRQEPDPRTLKALQRIVGAFMAATKGRK